MKAWYAKFPKGILCHRFRFIFFPVPKAATTSIIKVIAEMEGLPSEGNPHTDGYVESVRANHLQTYSDYRKFTVVRDPWDRLAACFNEKVKMRWLDDGQIIPRDKVFAGFARYDKILHTKLFHPDMTFDEFVNVIARVPDTFADPHFRSQHKMFCSPGGFLLVDRIIKLENFNDEMQNFLSEVGASDFSIKRLNRLAGVDYRGFYSESLAKIVARRYRRDIELLGYRF